MRPVAVAVIAVLVWFGCARDQRDLTAPRNGPPSLSLSRGQQPDLGPAIAAQERHTDRLLTIPGVVGTAVGLTADGRPAVKIFTKVAGVAGLPQSLEGVPVAVEVTGEIFAKPAEGRSPNGGTAASCTVSTCTNTDVWPLPVPIGVSTSSNAILRGFCFAGTIGARLKNATTGAVYALSNNHVYALENTVALGTDVLQPGLADTQCSPTGSNVLGTLFAFAKILFCKGNSCPSNTIDAATAVSDATKLDNKTPPAGYGTPNSSTAAATLGQSVQKYGRTTSLTTGSVTGINATVLVGYLTGTAKFVHQVVVGSCPTTCIGSGDSGSLLVTNDPSINPVGLLFAGTSDGSTAIANPIDSVLSYFGVAVDGSAPSSAPAAIGLSPASFSFSGPPDPPGQTLTISNTGGGTLTWAASSNASWLSVSPTSGTAPSSATVSVTGTAGLAAGSYSSTITVSATGASNSPQTAAVSLTVTSSALTASFTYSCSWLTCAFDASSSTGAATYSWDFGDGTTGAGVTTTHTFAPRKSYTVTLTVGNTGGTTNSTSQVLTCNPVQCH